MCAFPCRVRPRFHGFLRRFPCWLGLIVWTFSYRSLELFGKYGFCTWFQLSCCLQRQAEHNWPCAHSHRGSRGRLVETPLLRSNRRRRILRPSGCPQERSFFSFLRTPSTARPCIVAVLFLRRPLHPC